MREYLLATLTDEERGLAAALREDTSVTPTDFCRSIFDVLDDPLLSAEDVASLWGDGARKAAIRDALKSLVEDKYLETSVKTQRPFDPVGTELFRRAVNSSQTLRLTAIESQTESGDSRYQFSMEGRLVRGLARIDRLDSLAGTGNQRDEIKSHVLRIRDGISAGTQVPNPVLLVLLEGTTQILDVGQSVPDDLPQSFVVIRPVEEFQPVLNERDAVVQRSRIVEISFPWRKAAFDEEKSILLVDGQQRTAALSLISVERVPFIDIGVSAVSASEEEAKRVFQVANDSIKISTDFSKALLASMESAPGYLKNEQITAEAVRILSLDDTDSPFHGIVRYPGSRGSGAVVVYNSLFGIVTSFRKELPDDLTDTAVKLANIVGDAFNVVRDVWSDSWGLRPADSKLMHGAGLRAVTQVLIDKLTLYLTSGIELDDPDIEVRLKQSLNRLATRVVWTDTASAAGTATQKKNWREQISGKQNTNQDILALSQFLSRESVTLDMTAARNG